MPKIITFIVFVLTLLIARAALANLDLGLHVARVSANEGALVHRTETALVWQVVRVNGGKTVDKQDAFLSRHSPRVSLRKPCFGGNCRWSPYLTRDGVQPPGLLLRKDIWELRVLPIWLDVLRYADYLVSAQRSEDDPCHIPPRTWGGPMDRDKAIARGLYPIGCTMRCGGSLCDDGYTFYNDCWVEGRWVCDPTAEPVLQSVQPGEK